MPDSQSQQSFVELVEKAGGLLVSRPPERLSGFVLVVDFYSPSTEEGGGESSTLEFYFPEKASAEQFNSECMDMLEDDFNGWRILPGSLTSVKDYYLCAFCGVQKHEVDRLFRGNGDDVEGPSVCNRCVTKFSKELG
ncbi:MAG: hypothetical protein KDD55_08390 [Bdellovibrionales bacterium]|nr:hypothetical protein [Bdellovibrionales bacterium]